MAHDVAAIAWCDGGIDAAFAQARAQQRPLFLYWGAPWCPPCNRVKAEIFGHAGFAARMDGVLPFHLDGDSAGAQALAARYRLRSYPTLVLYAPDGAEITRLPCELDGDLFLAALDTALAVGRAGSSAAQALQAALGGARALSRDEWSLLGHYSWDTDEGQLLGQRVLADTLLALADGGAPAGTAARLRLHALLAAGTRAQADQDAAAASASASDVLLSLFADSALARANMDILNNHGLQLLKQVNRREEVAAALGEVARGWAEDLWLGALDRLAALRLRMRLARLLAPTQGLQQEVSERVVAALAASSEPHERHSLVNTAVSALNDAGLPQQAEQILLAELGRSHSPYYFMLSLAAGAKRRGDTAAVLDWYERAWQAAVGSATRLQWGATYLTSLIELAPQDGDRIAAAAQGLRREIGATADAFQQRNLSQLQRLLPKLDGVAAAGPLSDLLRTMS